MLAQERKRGWGQRAEGRAIPLNNIPYLGQLKPVMKPELDLQGLTVSFMDVLLPSSKIFFSATAYFGFVPHIVGLLTHPSIREMLGIVDE